VFKHYVQVRARIVEKTECKYYCQMVTMGQHQRMKRATCTEFTPDGLDGPVRM
jgi:hypothetical protein